MCYASVIRGVGEVKAFRRCRMDTRETLTSLNTLLKVLKEVKGVIVGRLLSVLGEASKITRRLSDITRCEDFLVVVDMP